MKEKNHLFSATGIPSLFLIFGVLMLVILSLLGYGTSRQDLCASSLSLEQTSAYIMPAVRQLIFTQSWFRHWKDFRSRQKQRLHITSSSPII